MKRRVLVTGASKGIGRAVAERLATAGFAVTVHYGSDQAGAETAVQTIMSSGGTASLLSFDIAERDMVQETLQRDVEEHGAYWGVVCNAGITRDASFPMMSGDDWDSVIHTNLDGFYNVVHPLVMPMVQARDGGRIVAMSSVSGIIGNRGQVNYSASKAALIGACKALALELAKRRITVNCVAPGLIDTGMVSEEVREHAMNLIPMRRVGSTVEVAATVDFLFSQEAAYITRQTISVNGGMT